MSLKSFHIVFVTFAFLMSLFFIFWSFVYLDEPSSMKSLIGYSGIAGLILTPIYGIYFWKKAAKIIL